MVGCVVVGYVMAEMCDGDPPVVSFSIHTVHILTFFRDLSHWMSVMLVISS